MRFTLNEWNEIYNAVKNELENVTARLNTRTEETNKTQELIKHKLALLNIIEKLETIEI